MLYRFIMINIGCGYNFDWSCFDEWLGAVVMPSEMFVDLV
jgi:hypothetical protein